jgi:membrane protease YdiL (CAAX protease family)
MKPTGGTMLAEIFGTTDSLVVLLIFLISLAVVIWAVVDAARQPALSSGAKAGWIISLVVGTFLFGIVGLVIAVVYLVGVRPRLTRKN